jgi:hypothetical protein
MQKNQDIDDINLFLKKVLQRLPLVQVEIHYYQTILIQFQLWTPVEIQRMTQKVVFRKIVTK